VAVGILDTRAGVRTENGTAAVGAVWEAETGRLAAGEIVVTDLNDSSAVVVDGEIALVGVRVVPALVES
jgi:hypothetical protein